MAESFGDERLAPGATAPESVPVGKTGVLLEPERSVGQRINPPEALSVRGLLLGVMALVDGTELLVELEEDAGGVPSGRKLGEASLELGEAGRRLWAAVRFDLTFLPSQPYWLLIRAATGRGMWLTEPGTEGVGMLERSGPQAPWRRLSTQRDATGSYRVLSAADELGDTCPVTFSVDGQTVEPSSRGAEFTVYELAPAVDQVLSRVGSEGPALVPLAFSAAVAGFLTVYPPVVKYRIPQ
ncbi:MAG: hypothetical protein GY867_08415 [bacterium]|nr:hypothetical protein [bacterium]